MVRPLHLLVAACSSSKNKQESATQICSSLMLGDRSSRDSIRVRAGACRELLRIRGVALGGWALRRNHFLETALRAIPLARDFRTVWADSRPFSQRDLPKFNRAARDATRRGALDRRPAIPKVSSRSRSSPPRCRTSALWSSHARPSGSCGARPHGRGWCGVSPVPMRRVCRSLRNYADTVFVGVGDVEEMLRVTGVVN